MSKSLQESTQSIPNEIARTINGVYPDPAPAGNAKAITLNLFNISLLTHWTVFVLYYISGRKSTFFSDHQ